MPRPGSYAVVDKLDVYEKLTRVRLDDTTHSGRQRGEEGGKMPPKKVTSTPTPVVIVRKKVAKGSGPSTPLKPTPQHAVPSSKPAPSVTPPIQPVAQPTPSATAEPSPPVLQPPPDASVITDSGLSKKEGEKQARRELLEVLRDRWP